MFLPTPSGGTIQARAEQVYEQQILVLRGLGYLVQRLHDPLEGIQQIGQLGCGLLPQDREIKKGLNLLSVERFGVGVFFAQEFPCQRVVGLRESDAFDNG
uniref:(northern house mosquito) hypothetical protein n=1 Tax=Culex pipiens TaxID=7175 RepID=A0A8D8FKW2_CULPI